MTDLTRRDALALGALLGGSAALAGVGAAAAAPSAPGVPLDTLPSLPVIRSRNGVLRTTLVATPRPTRLIGQVTQGLWTYNGLFSGPCLRAAPGDRIDITIRNEVSVPVNIHYHGLWVSPSGQADNVFVEAAPGESLQSRLTIPRSHQGGLFWIHPHVHGYSNEALWRGLSGTFIIDGGVVDLPEYRGCRHRVLVFKGFALDPAAATPTMLPVDQASAELVQFAVNGALNPTMVMRPGETQVWSLANTANDGFLRIAMDDHRMTVLAEDGYASFTTRKVREYVLAPGARVALAVTASTKPGAYALRSLGYDNGQFGQWLPQTLATVHVGGRPRTPVRAPARIMPVVSWLKEEPVKRRVFTLSASFTPETGPVFYINGKAFDHQDMHASFDVEVDTMEEWVVRTDPSLQQGGVVEGHPFHVHVAHFAVVGRGRWDPATGEATSYHAVEPYGLEDTAQVDAWEYLVMRLKFHKFTGKTVLHCHILLHQDRGMMGVFRIVKPGAGGGEDEHHHH